ncbi:MAG: aspartate--tRNA ligase [Clostridia bacterium]|nr:aspartate--tRNA ligase [Clostridia bacterium]MBO7250587.1 aspartate--tRNA ligase [Clostridia bacterium]
MAEFLTEFDKRSAYCAEISVNDLGKRVCVMGWVQKQRDLGALIFIDLRDRTGIVQLAFDDKTDKAIFDTAFGIRAEYTLCAKGVVRRRGEGAVNKNIPTGEIEIAVDELKILSVAQTPPFEIVEDSKVNAELRLKHRYLDLRRPDMQRNIIARSKIGKIARDYYADNGFIDIETPNLCKPTPEGARDYLVPSRVHRGKFYALPQSPQLYKQLLMVSGYDRYFQIARCFRDEDLRADRQPEFTQIDTEMSFVTADDVMQMHEGFIKYLFREYFGRELGYDLVRMPYREAMDRFGSDKPDVRFGFELNDISEIVKDSEFKVFSGAVAAGGSVRAINVKGGAKFSRKEIDSLTEFAKTYKARGVAWLKWTEQGDISSSYAKFLTEKENEDIKAALGAEAGDLILIVADKNKIVFDSLGALRCECAKRLGLLDPMDFKFLWVTEFPLFEYSEEDGRYYAMHHPFTAPMDEDLQYLETEPGRVRAKAYDIVLNGTELGGGSIRIHDGAIQSKMFETLGMTEEEANNKFGYLIEAFKYGVPPHGGLAFGFDRLVTLLLGLEDIRDVIAFPKVQNASELMTKCPSEPDPNGLIELGIAVVAEEE